MSDEVYCFEIGKEFPLFKGIKLPLTYMGAKMDYNDAERCLYLIFTIPDVTEEELEEMRGHLDLYLYEENDMALLLIKSTKGMIFEVLFNPSLYIWGMEGNEMRIHSNAIWMFTVDVRDNVLKNTRHSSMPVPIFKHLLEVWTKNMNTPGFTDKLTTWYNRLANKYTVDELISRAKYMGYFGQ